MRKILLPIIFLLVIATTALVGQAMAWYLGGTAQWGWNDETMGRSNFQHHFGTKKWAAFQVVVENKAAAYHLEQGANWAIYIVLGGKTVGSASGSVVAGNKVKRNINVNLNTINLEDLSVNGYIYNTAGNTGRVWVTVYADYAK